MQLAILAVVVCAISAASSEAAHTGGNGWRLLASLAFLSAAPLTALSFPGAARRSRLDCKSAADWRRDLTRWQSLVTWVWMGGCLAVLYIARLPDVVRSASFTVAWPLLDDLLILAPLVASLNLVWFASHRMELALHRRLNPAEPRPEATLRSYLELRWRHYLGLTLLPALVFLGLQESAAAMRLTNGANDSRAWWLAVLLVAGAVLALPRLLRSVWRTQFVMDSPLKRRLLESCRRVGCPVRDIVVWQTGGMVANAAVAGLIPRSRTIFLSDALIQRLSDDEIDVVVRHEAAHLAQQHLWQRLALLVLPLVLYAVIATHWPQALGLFQEQLAALGIAPTMQTSLLLPAAALAYALLAVGWLARLHEHDADLAACCGLSAMESSTGQPAGQLAVNASAVEHLHSALCKLVGDSPEYDRRRWFHPSVVERVDFLRRNCRGPALAARFRARMLWLIWGLVGICLMGALAAVWPL